MPAVLDSALHTRIYEISVGHVIIAKSLARIPDGDCVHLLIREFDVVDEACVTIGELPMLHRQLYSTDCCRGPSTFEATNQHTTAASATATTACSPPKYWWQAPTRATAYILCKLSWALLLYYGLDENMLYSQ